jgi:putative ABC transport system permease protein
MRALDRKLVRELWRLKGQVFSIAMVVATGIMSVVTVRGGYDSLVVAQARYYEETRFADVWASVKRAPEAVAREVAAIEGVQRVDTRVSALATLDLEGLDAPGTARFVSLPSRGRPRINDIHLLRGRLLQPGARDEVLINEKFADARGLLPGDSVVAILNGKRRALHVVGVANSPEFSYAVPPGSLYPDDERYGVFWMAREALGAVYDLDGAFNELVLTVAPGSDPEAVARRVDDVVDRYGGRGAYPRADQISHQILQAELDQNRVTSTAIPLVFLAVAAFLLNLVLGRMIATERTEIAVLKAFGYRDIEVGRHYLTFALAAVGVGTLIGGLGGVWLGRKYVELYGAYFVFPELEFILSPVLLLVSAGASAVAAGVGALGAVSSAVRLPPAEAMRPEPPPRFEPGPLERSGIGRVLPSAGRMILREIERRPMRSLLSSLGVAFSVAILVIGTFMFDAVTYMMDLQFRVIQREDLMLTFEEPLDRSVRYELAAMPGVSRVEMYRSVPARLWSGHREREVALQGLEEGSQLRRVVGADGRVHPIPVEGLVLSAYLAEALEVATGDTLRVEVLEGERREGPVVVAGVVDDLLGVSATMDGAALERLAGGGRVASGAWLGVLEPDRRALESRLKETPAVASVASPATLLENFEGQLEDSLYVSIGFLLGFAGVISVGIIYNGARISLSERGRELASLRVMGFRRSEVSALLLGEQALVTLVAIPVGWGLGHLLSAAILAGLRSETYRIPFVIGPATYLLSAGVTIAAAIASGWIVRRRIDTLDLIEVLKTRE